MQRVVVSIASLAFAGLAGLALLASLVGCATQECTYLNDCASAQVCSADGRCVAHDDIVGVAGGNGFAPGGGGGDDVDFVDSSYDELSGSDATLSGTIGPVGGFDGPATVVGWFDSGFALTNFQVMAESDEGYGLFILSFAGAVADLPPGETVLTADANAGGNTYAQLCSDTHGGLHFDGYPEETLVTVTPTDDGFDIDVSATITEGFAGANYDGAQPTVVHAGFRVLR